MTLFHFYKWTVFGFRQVHLFSLCMSSSVILYVISRSDLCIKGIEEGERVLKLNGFCNFFRRAFWHFWEC